MRRQGSPNCDIVSGTFSVILQLVVTEVRFGVDQSRELTDVKINVGRSPLEVNSNKASGSLSLILRPGR